LTIYFEGRLIDKREVMKGSYYNMLSEINAQINRFETLNPKKNNTIETE
jgi:hypothetical protein